MFQINHNMLAEYFPLFMSKTKIIYFEIVARKHTNNIAPSSLLKLSVPYKETDGMQHDSYKIYAISRQLHRPHVVNEQVFTQINQVQMVLTRTPLRFRTFIK